MEIFLLLLALVAFPLCVFWIKKNPLVGVGLVIFEALFSGVFLQELLSFSIGDFRITIADFCTMVFAWDLLGRLKNNPVRLGSIEAGLPLLLGLLVTIGVIRGVIDFGLQPAFNEGRAAIFQILVLVWVMQVEWSADQLRGAVSTFFARSAIAACALAVVNISTFGFHLNGTYAISESGAFIDLRPLNSIGALLLVGALISKTNPNQQSKSFGDLSLSRILGFTLSLFFLVASQQRTVLVCFVLGLLVATFLNLRKVKPYIVNAAALMFFLAAIFFSLFSKAATVFTSALTDEATLNSRQEGWISLVRALSENTLNLAIGSPFGTGFLRLEGGQLVTQNPHNWYIFLLLRLGVLGLVSFIVFMLVLTVRSRGSFVGIFLISFTILFGVTYLLPAYLALYLGLGARLARLETETRVREVDER